MIHCFEKVSGKKIPHQFAPRREGDLPCYYANPELAKKLLGWSAKHDLERMCTDVWRFASTRTTQ
jgi:UDP-glucose 4-epimerase